MFLKASFKVLAISMFSCKQALNAKFIYNFKLYFSNMRFKSLLTSRINSSIMQAAADFLFDSKIRFIIPIFLVAIFKILGSVWVYTKSLRNGVLQLPQMGAFGTIEPQWLYIYSQHGTRAGMSP